MLQYLRGYLNSDLALDLGTTNTLIGLADEGLVLDEPSVVAIGRKTRRVLSGGCAVGHLAKQLWGRTPDSIEVVRPLQDGVIADFELCEAMLRYFFHKAQRPGLRRKPRVVVAVPGRITRVEKRAVFNSVQRAGARQVWLIPQTKAAAIGAGLPIAEPVASMICDVGGGTTETAVVSVADLVSSESIRVGGNAMDKAIVDYLRRHYSLRIGLPTAERLRIDIGSAVPLEQEKVQELSGLDTISGLPRRAMITSEEIRQALGDSFTSITESIANVLDCCSPDLASDLVKNGLVLCGGGSLLPGIDRFLTEQTGLPTRVDREPRTAVARGLLMCMEHFERWKPALESMDDDV